MVPGWDNFDIDITAGKENENGEVMENRHTDDSVSLRQYVDKIFELNNKALDKALDELKEWKELHNGLQRKIEDDRNMYVKKEDLDNRIKVVWSRMLTVISIIVGLIVIYQFVFKK